MLRPTTLNDQLTDPLAQMREQANAMVQQMQAGSASGAPDANYPGAQAAAMQARAPVGGPAANTAFGAGPAAQGRNAPSVIANPEGGLLSVRATSRQHEKVQEFLDIIMSRSLNFEDVPPELMAGVDVYKNPSAEQIEGSKIGRAHV